MTNPDRNEMTAAEELVVAMPQTSILRISTRTAVVLLIFTIAFTALMAGTYSVTEPLVTANAKEEKLRMVGEVLSPSTYDNSLLDDAITLSPSRMLGLDDNTLLYRARKNGQPVALVFEAAAPDGYSGRINLILAMSADGRLLAQRVILHKETPGLGDYIDPKKDRNKARPWISQFDGHGYDDVLNGRWKVRKDGGQFDQRAGATISARAVTNASGRALMWAHERSRQLFELQAGGQFVTEE